MLAAIKCTILLPSCCNLYPSTDILSSTVLITLRHLKQRRGPLNLQIAKLVAIPPAVLSRTKRELSNRWIIMGEILDEKQ